ARRKSLRIYSLVMDSMHTRIQLQSKAIWSHVDYAHLLFPYTFRFTDFLIVDSKAIVSKGNGWGVK
ncbi:MAG: hypothetical protein ABIN67_17920, partial [Ferruginibacter sp.]